MRIHENLVSICYLPATILQISCIGRALQRKSSSQCFRLGLTKRMYIALDDYLQTHLTRGYLYELFFLELSNFTYGSMKYLILSQFTRGRRLLLVIPRAL